MYRMEPPHPTYKAIVCSQMTYSLPIVAIFIKSNSEKFNKFSRVPLEGSKISL